MQVGTAGLTKGLDTARASIAGFGSSVRSIGSSVISSFNQIGLAIQSVQSIVSGLTAVVGGPLQLAAQAEQTAVSFEVLLGSAEEANKVLADLRQFGAETPFDFPELADAGKKLIAFGFSAEDLVPQMRRLGDISAGLGIPFSELSEIWGKLKVQGRVMGEDMNQLLGRGIPVAAELAKQFGVTEAEVKDLVSQGLVNFEHMQKALESLTGEGGKFAGLMAAQSQTLGGIWGTLKDTFNSVLLEVGNALVETFDLKGAASNLTAFVESTMPRIQAFLEYFKVGFEAIKPILVQTVTAIIAQWRMIADQIGWAVNKIGGLLSNIGLPSFETFRSFVLDGLIAVEFAWTNWRRVGELSLKSLALGVVSFAGQVQHFFGTVIPTLFKFVRDNWWDILHDMATAQRTVFKNISKNIVAVLKNLPKLIKGQVSFSELWTPLLDGAEFQLKKLPDIPPRVMGDLEKSLRKDVGNLKQSLGKDFAKFREDRLKDLLPPPEPEKALDKIKSKAKETQEALKDTTPKELIEQEQFQEAAAELLVDVRPKEEIKFASALELGSQEARQAIIKHQFGGRQQDPLSNLERNSRDQLAIAKRQTDYLKQLATQNDEVFTLA